MPLIQEALEKIGTLEAQLQASEETVKAAQQQVAAKWQNLKKLIHGGKSTGNPIRDFVIVSCGYDNPEIEAKYRLVHENILAHPGEFLLVVERETDSFFRGGPGHGGCFPQPDFQYVKTNLSLGIIAGPMIFNVSNGRCSLPFGGRYACQQNFSQAKLIQGDYDLSHFTGRDIRFLIAIASKGIKGIPSFELMIGDKEVIAWINKQRGVLHNENQTLLLFRKMCVLLGRFVTFEEQTALLKKETATIRGELEELGLKKQLLSIRLKRKKNESDAEKRDIERRLETLKQQITKTMAEAAALGIGMEGLRRQFKL